MGWKWLRIIRVQSFKNLKSGKPIKQLTVLRNSYSSRLVANLWSYMRSSETQGAALFTMFEEFLPPKTLCQRVLGSVAHEHNQVMCYAISHNCVESNSLMQTQFHCYLPLCKACDPSHPLSPTTEITVQTTQTITSHLPPPHTPQSQPLIESNLS